MAGKLHIKVPRQIAGIRIPKRKRKGPVRAFLASSAGQVIVAEILLAVAGAVVAVAVARSGRHLPRAIVHGVEMLRDTDGATVRKRSTGLLAAAVTVATGRALDALLASVARRRKAGPEIATAQGLSPVES